MNHCLVTLVSAVLFLLFATILLFTGRTESRTRPQQVIVVGDSITQFGYTEQGCWLALLSNALRRRCDVINRGYGGYNTKNIREYLPEIIDGSRADITSAVVIFLGANDSHMENIMSHVFVPILEYKENLRAIIEYLESIGISKGSLVLVPSPPSDPEKWKQTLEKSHNRPLSGLPKTKENDLKYNKAAIEVAKEMEVEFVDIYDRLNNASLFRDGVHFTKEGSHIFFGLLYPAVNKRVTKEIHLPVHVNGQ